MTRLLIVFVILTSCKTTSLPTQTLTADENDMLCNGARNMFHFIKESKVVKDRYKIQEITLKTNQQIYSGIPYSFIDNNAVETLGDTAIKRLNIKCNLTTDKNPHFDLIYFYSPDRKTLVASIGTIVNRKSWSTGFHFITNLTETGELGEVTIEYYQQ
jgi:hypothetical protein